MNHLNLKAFGFAVATVSAVLYAACAFVMAADPRATAIRFFNSLTHGVDWEPILRFDMAWSEMAIGISELFILSWLAGAAIAALYNVGVEGRS